MLTQDGLVVVDTHLDRARLQIDRVDSSLNRAAEGGDAVVGWLSASQQSRRASIGLERARTYLRAAQQTISDVADDVARGAVGRAGEDLRLLERLCAMVDELSGQAARNLASTSQDRSAPDERGRDVSTVLGRIDRVRSSVQAAGRLAAELTANQLSAASDDDEPVVQRLRAEQQGRQPASNPVGAIGMQR